MDSAPLSRGYSHFSQNGIFRTRVNDRLPSLRVGNPQLARLPVSAFPEFDFLDIQPWYVELLERHSGYGERVINVDNHKTTYMYIKTLPFLELEEATLGEIAVW